MVRIPMSALETLNKPWFDALKAMDRVVRGGALHMTQEERATDAAELTAHGQAAMDFLKDGKPALADLLEMIGEEYTDAELNTVYVGLKDMSVDTTKTQFDKELKSQIALISNARNRILLQERWRSMTGLDTVKEWCAAHGAPLLLVVTKEQRKAFTTLISVQKSQRTLNQDVLAAISVLKSMDQAILSNDQLIMNTLLETVGPEYREVFEAERDMLLNKAKMQLGNDMSAWEIDDLKVLQNILKKAQQDKAKREKLTSTKTHVQTMNEGKLRSTVQAFLDAHPEFCDDFNR